MCKKELEEMGKVLACLNSDQWYQIPLLIPLRQKTIQESQNWEDF